MKTNTFLVGTFLLSCSLGWPLTAQEPDAAQVRRKALEAERDKLAQRLGEIDAALAKLKPGVKPGEPLVIEGFLGISSDFSVYAVWDVDSVAFMEFATKKRLPAPHWESEWGLPRDVLFGANFVAVHAIPPPIKSKKGHLDAVGAMTFFPSGDFLVTSAKDKTVRFWSTATGKSVHTIKNLPAAISAIVLAPDGKRILTVSGDSRNPAEVRGEIRNFDLK